MGGVHLQQQPSIRQRILYRSHYPRASTRWDNTHRACNAPSGDTGFQSEVRWDRKGLEQEKEGGGRCYKCYKLRLEKACLYAKQNNYDYFTTTLTISPLKNSKVLNEIGHELEEKYDIPYLYSDFKKREGYKRSIVLSHQYNLYRQDYCGCEFSKRGGINE